ncbi:undecaprenyl-phosphate galactose phosphotransferase [Myxococcaceae bacterium]|jgi:lipopolysaccharide/colanic/teichoic acid biosynthesis glycosyltransferase/tetratricopeptide (TPR) repeat protein|nr:undecaprenyl-phosphate galactose phosphotransferase [Myxococcaceae bacterium]
MLGKLARQRAALLDRGVEEFRNADPEAAETFHGVLRIARLGGFGSRFDSKLAHFYLSELHRIQGFEAMFRGRPYDALRLLDASTAHNPENFQALYGAAVCANAVGDYEKAIALLERLFGVERCTQRLSTHLAAVLVNAGRLGEASRRLEKALEGAPKFADLNHLLGVCRWRQGRRVEALELLRRCVEGNPRYAWGVLRFGAAQLLCGDPAGAAATLSEGIEATPLPDPGPQLFEALCSLEAVAPSTPDREAGGELDELARKLAEDALHARLLIHPLAVGLHVTDEEVGAGPGYDEALVAAYESIISEAPHEAHLRYRLGRLLQRMGREDEARACWKQAIDLEPRAAAWPGVAEQLGLDASSSEQPPKTGRYDEVRDGVAFDFDPAVVPEPCHPPHQAKPLGRIRRAIDLLVVVPLLLAATPLMLLVALAIRLESRGPALFRQTRVGWNGRRFTIYKFRSMIEDAGSQDEAVAAMNDADGPLFKIKDDPRVTRVGRALRRRSLDELPQLLNVLRGEMTLIGPRPLIEREVVQMTDWELRRLLVTPGLVGLAQICGRSDLRFHEWIRLDTFYVAKQGLVMDLGIAWRALWSVLAGKGAY